MNPMADMQMLEEAAYAMTLCDPDRTVDDGTQRLGLFRVLDAQDSLNRLLTTTSDWDMFRKKFPEAAAVYDKTRDRIKGMIRKLKQ